MVNQTDILIFVEDPGAANYVAPLPGALDKRSIKTKILATGPAEAYLAQRGIQTETMNGVLVVETILWQIHPRLILVGTSENPDTLGLQIIKKARDIGIETVGIVDGLSNADYRFRGRNEHPLAFAPDWLLVPDNITRDIYIRLGFCRSSITACGHPHYDYVRGMAVTLKGTERHELRRSLLPRVTDDHFVVVFIAEISTGLNQEQYRRSADYTLSGRGTNNGRTEIVLDEFLDAMKVVNPSAYLVLRLHPKNKLQEFDIYLSEFDYVSQGGSSLELLYVSDLVVGMSSMTMLEAAILQRPTLSILPRTVETNWLSTIAAGVTPCATNRRDLYVLLRQLSDGTYVTFSVIDDVIKYNSLKQVSDFLCGLLNYETT